MQTCRPFYVYKTPFVPVEIILHQKLSCLSMCYLCHDTREIPKTLQKPKEKLINDIKKLKKQNKDAENEKDLKK